jgi:hypothetical protein
VFYQIINQYVFILGIVLTGMGIIELLIPMRIFNLWEKWISHKLFFLHGLLLILLGFPLTLYKNLLNLFIAKSIFGIGVIAVLIGPFILFYPEKIREIFLKISGEVENKAAKRIIYLDAIIRISVGLLFIYSNFA